MTSEGSLTLWSLIRTKVGEQKDSLTEGEPLERAQMRLYIFCIVGREEKNEREMLASIMTTRRHWPCSLLVTN